MPSARFFLWQQLAAAECRAAAGGCGLPVVKQRPGGFGPLRATAGSCWPLRATAGSCWPWVSLPRPVRKASSAPHRFSGPVGSPLWGAAASPGARFFLPAQALRPPCPRSPSPFRFRVRRLGCRRLGCRRLECRRLECRRLGCRRWRCRCWRCRCWRCRCWRCRCWRCRCWRRCCRRRRPLTRPHLIVTLAAVLPSTQAAYAAALDSDAGGGAVTVAASGAAAVDAGRLSGRT